LEAKRRSGPPEHRVQSRKFIFVPSIPPFRRQDRVTLHPFVFIALGGPSGEYDTCSRLVHRSCSRIEIRPSSTHHRLQLHRTSCLGATSGEHLYLLTPSVSVLVIVKEEDPFVFIALGASSGEYKYLLTPSASSDPVSRIQNRSSFDRHHCLEGPVGNTDTHPNPAQRSGQDRVLHPERTSQSLQHIV